MNFDYKKQGKAYSKTIKGVVNDMYCGQRKGSKDNGFPMPAYTRKELFEWCNNQTRFHVLYIHWVNGGFRTGDKPSVDRINHLKPYTMDNIQIMSCWENQSKASTETRYLKLKAQSLN